MASEVYFHPPPHFFHLKIKIDQKINENVCFVQQTDDQCLTLVRPCPLKWAKTTAAIHRGKKIQNQLRYSTNMPSSKKA